MEEKIKKLIDHLKEGVVVFEYEKKDGSTRVAKGTLKKELLPPVKEDEEIIFDKLSIDTLIGIKYESLDEYMKLNKVELVGETEDGKNYRFKYKKEKRKVNENLQSYYDIEKESFRSFDKNNFKRIISCS
jgi:hypothetical protein